MEIDKKSAEIRLNTINKPRVLVAPYKYQPSHEEVIPRYISLGHELIHALTFFKGLSSRSQTVIYYYVDEHGNRVADSGLKEELETVGIFGSQLGITENSIRREHGLDIRVRYRGRQ